MVMMCRGFRGATTASANTKAAINDATEEMLRALVKVNDLAPEFIAAASFFVTPDLNAEYPASVARRRLGWTYVALTDAVEIDVPYGLPMCIRVLILANTEKAPEEIKNVYLRGAENLRQRSVSGS
jgi:chorismate mutase